jgi:hypothetical protein
MPGRPPPTGGGRFAQLDREQAQEICVSPVLTGDARQRPSLYLMSDSSTSMLHPGEGRRLPPEDSSCSSHAINSDGHGIGAYSEEAFRYLLAIERKRAERSGRPFYLLLLDLKRASVGTRPVDIDVALTVFTGLSTALRDTDFTGWYREGRIAGAVLTQFSDVVANGVSETVSERVREHLLSRIPVPLASRLQTRIFQLPRTSRS